MYNKLISFVLPAYKTMFLCKAIESIIKQTYKNWELIIVDDASPEAISEIVSRYSDIRIHYSRNKYNVGKTNLISNWNTCISFAHGEYVILASDDDIYDKFFLEETARVIEKFPSVNVIRSGVKKIDMYDNVIDVERPFSEYMTSSDFSFFWSKGLINCIGNYIFKREELLRIGGFMFFPMGHFSDDATVLTLSKHGIACLSNNYFSFRISSINLSNIKNSQTVKGQIIATHQFIKWFNAYLYTLPENKYFPSYKDNAFENYRRRYYDMLKKLSAKLSILNIIFVFKMILNNHYLYRREKFLFIIQYIMEKF